MTVPFDEIFQNEHFIAVEKRPLTLSVPSRSGAADLRPCVGSELQKILGKQIYPVHRLDFEVGGVLLFAKNTQAQKWASRQFEEHLVQKTYRAVAPRSLESQETFRWMNRIHRGKKRSFEALHGKEAITEARIISSFSEEKDWDLWELRPKTGRPHQLRFHMMLHVKPIIGDHLYGSLENWIQPGIALHAVALEFADCENFGLPQIIRSLETSRYSR